MANLYFDESIRETGGFIIGALVVASTDISRIVRRHWQDMGYDPDSFEYKSSTPKANDPASRKHREIMRRLLHSTRLAFTISPCTRRHDLGEFCASLISQLQATGTLSAKNHMLFVDQNILMSKIIQKGLVASGVSLHLGQDSRVSAGLQVADHAAHALGGMLLEEMGVVRKMVSAGKGSGYDRNLEIELGFELWASLRHSLICGSQDAVGLSPMPEDFSIPTFRVDGYGMYLAPSCSDVLVRHARNRFRNNYLGCIH